MIDKKEIVKSITANNPALNQWELIDLSIHALVMIELQTEIEKTNFKLKISKNRKHENN
jgi:hypothetical protein